VNKKGEAKFLNVLLNETVQRPSTHPTFTPTPTPTNSYPQTHLHFNSSTLQFPNSPFGQWMAKDVKRARLGQARRHWALLNASAFNLPER